MEFSILAFIALILSICLKKRKRALIVQAFECLFSALYAFYISAITAGVIEIINAIRTSIFINKKKIGKSIYLGILIFFEILIMTNCYLSWAGVISLLPTIGSMIRTYCLWQSDMKWVRLSGITTGIFYGAYYIFYEGWFMVLGYTVLLLVSIYEMYINDFRKKDNVKETKD